MDKKLLDLLACPIEKHHPLHLHAFETAFDDIVYGALLCPQCSRRFPIIDSIPMMLPDEMRNFEEEKVKMGKYIEDYKRLA